MDLPDLGIELGSPVFKQILYHLSQICGFISGLYSVPLTYVCASVPVQCYFDYCSLTCPALVFSDFVFFFSDLFSDFVFSDFQLCFSDCFGNLGSFVFPNKL